MLKKPQFMEHWSWTDAGMLRNAWIMWAAVLIAVCVLIGRSSDPVGTKSVTGNYRKACVAWWERQPMYRLDDPNDIDGFLYFPQAAILHTPFSFGPAVAGEWLWRLFILGLFTAGLWRVARVARPDGGPGYFAVMSFLAVFSVAGNLRNGQSNLLMAGTMMLAAAELADRRWWWATLWLVLGLAFKPLGLVMILLVGALYPRPMAWRLMLGIVGLAVMPFLFAGPGYAWSQYADFVAKMRAASVPDRAFPDIKGMTDSFGLALSERVLFVIRAVAAPVTLGLVWLAMHRFGPRIGALALLTGASVYLMLFNPRTEGLSYVALAPVLGVFACWSVWERPRPWVAAWLVIYAALLGLEYELFGKRLGTGNWFKPLMCSLFVIYVMWLVVRGWCPAPGLLPGSGAAVDGQGLGQRGASEGEHRANG